MPNMRRAFQIRYPGVQLRLPLQLLAIALVCGGVFVAQSLEAYRKLYEMLVSAVPPSFEAEIEAQATAYLIVTVVIALVYALAVMALCVIQLGRLTGPVVAVRRCLDSLIQGKYERRIAIRKGDEVFQEIAEKLNHLAETLEQRQRAPKRPQHRTGSRALREINHAVPEDKDLIEA